MEGSEKLFEKIRENELNTLILQMKKDRRGDCPQIYLIHVDKVADSCTKMQEKGYKEPLLRWNDKVGTLIGDGYLVVSPGYKWEEIAEKVRSFFKKGAESHSKPTHNPQKWPI